MLRGKRKENFWKPRLALVALGQWSFAKKRNMLNWQHLIIPRRVESSHACVSLVRIVDVQHHSTESGPMLQPCRGTNSGYIVYISYTSAISYYCFYMQHVQNTYVCHGIFSIVTFLTSPGSNLSSLGVPTAVDPTTVPAERPGRVGPGTGTIATAGAEALRKGLKPPTPGSLQKSKCFKQLCNHSKQESNATITAL